jgi:hypothetical protein
MPWTFSHPLADLPLRRWCPRRLNFIALIIGSLSPDFAYYTGHFQLATFAHTAVGTVAFCLPSGLLAVALFLVLRQPLCHLLPQPHRAALMPLAMQPTARSVRGIGIIAASILIGAWTHTVWDSFTHHAGWAVARLPFLRATAFQIGGTEFPVFYLLQQTSTFLAAGILVTLYIHWLRHHRSSAHSTANSEYSERTRYLLLGCVTLVALAVAGTLASRMASQFEGFLAFRVFLFRLGVYSGAAFAPLFIITAVTFYLARRPDHQR